jgi:hypothetical protein
MFRPRLENFVKSLPHPHQHWLGLVQTDPLIARNSFPIDLIFAKAALFVYLPTSAF